MKTISSVNLSLRENQFIALLGPNGSGKSTLAKICCGLIEPDEGKVTLNGSPLKNGWNGIGYLFQNPDDQLIKSSVEDELAWGLENLNLDRVDISKRVEEALKKFDLKPKRSTPPDQLSDGEKQLAALASVLIMQPEILILDEVTAFLDSKWSEKILSITKESMNSGSILLLSCNVKDASTSDEIWIIQNGDILKNDSVDFPGGTVDYKKHGLISSQF